MRLVAKPNMMASSKLFFIAFPPLWSVVSQQEHEQCAGASVFPCSGSKLHWHWLQVVCHLRRGYGKVDNKFSREAISQDLEASAKFLASAWPFPGAHVLKRHVQSLYCECQKFVTVGQSAFVPPFLGRKEPVLSLFSLS